MCAARVHAWEGAPVIEDVPEPAVGEGESLIEVAAAAVAHIDLTVASGTFAFRPDLPYIPGTEAPGASCARAASRPARRCGSAAPASACAATGYGPSEPWCPTRPSPPCPTMPT